MIRHHQMKWAKYLLASALALPFSACDDGDIPEKVYTVAESGLTVKVTATVSGLSQWDGSGYTLAVAGFQPDSKFAMVQRAVTGATADGTPVSIVLSSVGSEVKTVEVALTNSLRKRIITLASIDMADYSAGSPRDTIRLDLGDVDVSRLGVLQMGIFDRACIQCHGASGRSAAGLNLTAGNAEANLVDVPSSRLEGYRRVESGNAEGSLLHLILQEGGENLLTHNHTEILSSQFKTNLEEVSALIDSWIDRLGK